MRFNLHKYVLMKNIAFIINPISGTQNKRKLPKYIDQLLDKEQWMANVVYTEYAGHATELAHQFAVMGFDAVVAVGGDGTLNEVARGLRGTKTAMGIIPMGSGNGFARHLNIPLRANNAIEMLNHSEPISVDYGIASSIDAEGQDGEERMFISTCGAGFDALIAEHFDKAGSRGFKTYLEKVIKDFITYEPKGYRIKALDGQHTTIEGKTQEEDIDTKAFLITFANASQWGYEARIAPKASIQDGKMDICIMHSNALLGAPGLAIRLFTKSLDQSMFMDTYRAKDIILEREENGPFHIDGDPVEMSKDIHIRIVPDGLRVLVEKRF